MSSIAYVTDSKMLEYHRLCRNRTILFWRLSNRKKFSNFKKGDLLFFFSRPNHGRKKGLIGYAHYDSIKRLSLQQMWKQYSEATGYETKQRLEEAISKAAKGEVPKIMHCLYLTDVVFFISPVYPDEIEGLEIPTTLESYIYLDKNDADITVKILKVAAKHGIDLWSADPKKNPDEIFKNDVIRQEISFMHSNFGKDTRNEKEKKYCYQLAKNKIVEQNWELIRGSKDDCLYLDKNKIRIAIAFHYQNHDRNVRIRELLGKIAMYHYFINKRKFDRIVQFDILMDNPEKNKDILEMVEYYNNG